MDSMRSVSNTGANLVRGLHGGNLQPVAQTLSEHSAGMVDGIGTSRARDLGEDLKKLKVAVNMEQMGREGAAKSDSATAFMVAGAMLGGTVGVVLLEHTLNTIVNNPAQLKEFAAKIADEQAAAPAQLDSLNNRVVGALVKDGVQPGNVPTALFMAGVELDRDQRRGLLPGQE
jgi:hypothetical protein